MFGMASRRVFLLGLAGGGVASLRAANPPAKHEPPPLPPQAKEVSIDDIEKLLRDRKDVFVLDVRSAEEIQEEGKLTGAKHIDYFASDFEGVLNGMGVDVTKPCVVYCAFGARARRAAQRLAKFGCKSILLPAGGFNAWKKAGKPVEGGVKKQP
jgi:rhodanese-related sulfurtransferase